ncbi:DUF4124 domain-containing protein [Marinobacter zhanjiangensis]|uniref:DUF4124 domain-containing protein n=1 Tax=Marinobacter zhanjiangensis TaxID=578215 RepID=A0ABQ3B1T6_9GAMM|nr:DUF4124 domain-containing protein [Marinobacter zhanjiangensis]GGY73597.1 hypothetical protein GCM10007071_21040 [Marinobacter zhanjiangensis]
MTRWLIRLAFPALAVLVGFIVYGVKAPDNPAGQSPEQSESDTIPSFEAVVPAPVIPEGPEIVFKWQDEDGGWHYADQPPAEGPWYTLTVDPGPETRPATPDGPDPADEDLNSPYSAPFSLGPRYPENGS